MSEETTEEEYNEYRYNEKTDEWEYVGPEGCANPLDVEFRIYCNGFWGSGYGTSFTDRTTSGAMNASFFAEIFEK